MVGFSRSILPMARKSIEPVAPEPASYEAALAELEGLVSAMEGGQMPLDQLLGSYQRGASLLEFCRSRLKAVEEQVKSLDDSRGKDGPAA
jgi:exodeoxyribonuclease VII small subunit